MIDMPIITLILKVLTKTHHDKKRDRIRVEQFIGDLQPEIDQAKRINVRSLSLMIAET
jgi:hypothetical protein